MPKVLSSCSVHMLKRIARYGMTPRRVRYSSVCTKIVDLEDQFIDLAYSMGPVKGLRDSELKQYIRYIADRRLISMGMKGIFKVKKNPLPWVEEMINAPTHTNFFENRATDYAKGALSGSWDEVWAT